MGIKRKELKLWSGEGEKAKYNIISRATDFDRVLKEELKGNYGKG